MNDLAPSTSTNKAQPLPRQGGAKARISEPLRKAIKLKVENGLTIGEACAKAGISEAGYYKAMLRPAVRAHFEAVEIKFIQEVERRRAGYKARAIEVAAALMERGTSEAVRMRAVEFFAGEARGPVVQVQVNNPASAYRYARPTDGASGGDQGQVIDVTPQSTDVGTEG